MDAGNKQISVKKKVKMGSNYYNNQKKTAAYAQILGWGLFETHCSHSSQELRKYWKLGKTFKVVCTTNE